MGEIEFPFIVLLISQHVDFYKRLHFPVYNNALWDYYGRDERT